MATPTELTHFSFFFLMLFHVFSLWMVGQGQTSWIPWVFGCHPAQTPSVQFHCESEGLCSCPFLSLRGGQEHKGDISANLENYFPTQSPGQYRLPTFFSLSCARQFCKEYSNYIKLSGQYNYSVCPNTLYEYYVVVLIKQKVVYYKANYIMPKL